MPKLIKNPKGKIFNSNLVKIKSGKIKLKSSSRKPLQKPMTRLEIEEALRNINKKIRARNISPSERKKLEFNARNLIKRWRKTYGDEVDSFLKEN